MIKKISGSWIEFQHHTACESKYYEGAINNFTAEQWDEKIKEQAELGFEYLVLMASAQDGKAYFDTSILPKAKLGCGEDPIGAMFSAADKYGMKFFMSTGYYFSFSQIDDFHSDKFMKIYFQAMNELYEKYSKYKSFYGWYFPVEAYIEGLFKEEYIKYVNLQSKESAKIDKSKKTLIAPFGTNKCFSDDRYVRQLENLDIDFIAYQDEVGVRKTKVDELERIYARIKKSHDKAGRAKLWADVEIFEFEAETYKSALMPADFPRVKQQIEIISPFVETILIYQYTGIMSKPGSSAPAGSENSEKLYTDYANWLKNK